MIEIKNVEFFLLRSFKRQRIAAPINKKSIKALVDLKFPENGVGYIKPCMYSMVEIIKKVLFKKALNSSLGKSKKIKLQPTTKEKIKSNKFLPSSLNNKKIANIKRIMFI